MNNPKAVVSSTPDTTPLKECETEARASKLRGP